MDYNGNIKSLGKKKIKFGYRQSSLEKFIILSACLRLAKRSREKIKRNLKQYLKARHNSQDTTSPNAGCIFKNPFGESAGRLIDMCGLKGKKIGDACISEKHANFIVNTGHARAEDVLRLMNLIKKKVKNKFDINLEPEIKIWQ
jgi:UDP-N-acetylmuramate dehydrogenase